MFPFEPKQLIDKEEVVACIQEIDPPGEVNIDLMVRIASLEKELDSAFDLMTFIKEQLDFSELLAYADPGFIGGGDECEEYEDCRCRGAGACIECNPSMFI